MTRLSQADTVAMVTAILREAPDWAEAVRDYMHDDRARLTAMIDSHQPIPASVRPVLARIVAGHGLRLAGRPPAHSYDVEARAWYAVMARREHLGMSRADAETAVAKMLGLGADQVRSIINRWARMGMTHAKWREITGR